MRRTLLAASLLIFTSLQAWAGDTRLVVVELFTSQGCYSCPPADRFAGKLRARPDVLPLSYHVDYWDYIGWKDPFALPSNAARQRDYAASFGLHSIYTPQMVVSGQFEGVGSREARIEGLIEKVKTGGKYFAAPKIVRDPAGRFRIDIPEAAYGDSADVYFIAFEGEKTQVISRGENAGKTLTYYNVVRDFSHVGSWGGEARQFDIEAAAAMPAGADGCAVIVQERASGAIIGAARLSL